MNDELMQEEDIYLPMPATPGEDETIYAALRSYLLEQVNSNAELDEVGEDADVAFVVTAFARPKSPAPFAGLTPRMSRVLALHSFILQVCPTLELTEDGKTDSACVMRTGVHAVAAQILVRTLMSRVMPAVVDGARSLVMARESHLHD